MFSCCAGSDDPKDEVKDVQTIEEGAVTQEVVPTKAFPDPPVDLEEEASKKLAPILRTTINFGEYSWNCCEIEKSSEGQIKKIADVLKEYSTVGVKIQVVSEKLPWKQWQTEEHGSLLSLMRARAVRDAIKGQGVTNQISVKGLGSQNNKGPSVEVTVAKAAEVEGEIGTEAEPPAAPTYGEMETAQEKLNIVLKDPIPFGGGNTNLSSKADAQIKKIAEVLIEYPSLGMKLAGFTGGVPKPTELSMGRCRKVREALNKAGAKNPMSAKGMGNKDGKPRVEMTMADAAEVEAEAKAEPEETAAEKVLAKEVKDDDDGDDDKAPAIPVMADYDGNYFRPDGKDMCGVKGGTLTWHDRYNHATVQVTLNDAGALVMTLQGKPHTATLDGNVLTWDDGDKWNRK